MPKKKNGSRSSTDFDVEVGRRLRLARLHSNLSQEHVATTLGISFQQVQKYEKGVNRVAVEKLAQLAQLLNTTPHDLMGYKSTFKVGSTIDAMTVGLVEEFIILHPELKSPFKTLMHLMTELIAAASKKKK
jgi:transcriptional regulator with XRE-family HTH domain